MRGRSFSRPSAITDRLRPSVHHFHHLKCLSCFGLILDEHFAREGGRDWWSIGISRGQENGRRRKMATRVGWANGCRDFFLTPSEPQSTSFAITRLCYASRFTCDVYLEARRDG
ncbi:hypothetical protein BT69DRAFT_315594 [Atractiella rhizophila]|nr:hypothetical protein BT69DRAFT_315594 [Atractiella rhizophila]